MSRRRRRSYRLTSQVTNYWSVITVFVVFAISVGLFYFGTAQGEPWKSIIANLAGSLFAVATLSLLWELRAKRLFAQEMMELVAVSSEIEHAGIVSATKDFADVHWEELLRDSSDMDILISFGRTWRESNRVHLSELARRKGRIRIALPDPDDGTLLTELGERFGMVPAEVKTEILKAQTGFEEVLRDSSNLQIFAVRCAPTYTYYRFGERTVVALYTHRREKTSVPVLVCRSGTYSTFFRDDFEKMLSHGTTRPLPKRVATAVAQPD